MLVRCSEVPCISSFVPHPFFRKKGWNFNSHFRFKQVFITNCAENFMLILYSEESSISDFLIHPFSVKLGGTSEFNQSPSMQILPLQRKSVEGYYLFYHYKLHGEYSLKQCGTTWPPQGLVLSHYGLRPGSKLNLVCDLIGRKRSFSAPFKFPLYIYIYILSLIHISEPTRPY